MASALSSLATALFEADSSPDIAFVRAQAGSGNGQASGIADELASLWQEYALAKEASDALIAAVGAGDRAESDRLLGPSALTLPDGSTAGLRGVVDDMPGRLDAAVTAMGRLAATARQALGVLDAVTVEAGELLVRATALGIEDDPEITRLRAALDDATRAVAADPTTDPAGLTEPALAAARRRVDEMEGRRVDLSR